jgi:uncharacterized membrane protein
MTTGFTSLVRTEMGWHLVVLTADLGLLMANGLIFRLLGDYPGRQVVNTVLFAVVVATIVWRILLLHRATKGDRAWPKRKREAMAEPAFQERALKIVRDYVHDHLDPTDPQVPDFDVYVVWFAKVLANWKALVSTTLPDGMYYEVTHNGAGRETYLDAYKKVQNQAIPD